MLCTADVIGVALMDGIYRPRYMAYGSVRIIVRLKWPKSLVSNCFQDPVWCRDGNITM